MHTQRILPLLIYGLALPLAAQPATHFCADVATPAERLACYDTAFPPPPEVGEAAIRQAEAGFGFSSQRESLRNPGQTSEQADPDRLESRVARIDYPNSGSRSFYFENGQVWVQTESHTRGHVQAGDLVQVRKALLGGYQLITPGGVALRVRRAQ